MASRDVAQLILEVDARIATAQRAVNQLARSIQSDASSMERSLDGVAKSHARIGQAFNDNNSRVRAGFTQLSFQIGDVTQQMSLGVSGARIFAQQSGQVIQALQVMGGEGNKFLQFLGGPWGIAISTAAVILAPLASKLFDTGDEVGKLVDKMRDQAKQAALNEQADAIWKGTIEGLTDAIRKRREEQEKSLKSDVLQEEDSRRAAQKELDDLTKQRDRLAKQVREFIAANASGPGRVGTTALGHTIIEESDRKLAEMEGKLAQVNRSIAAAEANVRGAEIPILDRRAEGRIDAVKAQTDAVKAAIGALHAQYTAGQITLAKYNAELDKQNAKLKALQETANKSSGFSGKQIGFTEAAAIARGAGYQVNSAQRPSWIKNEVPGGGKSQERLFNEWVAAGRPKDNPVAPPGTSAHEGAKGKWALDIQIKGDAKVEAAKLKKLFGDRGVDVNVFPERGHLHVSGSRSEAAKAENEAETAQQRAVRQQNAFEEQRDRLNQELLVAQAQLVQGIDAQAKVAEEQVRAEFSRRDAAIQNDVEEKKYSQAQADQLKAINTSIQAERLKAIAIGRQVATLQRQDEKQQRSFEYQVDDLRFADQMATTQAAHRRLQLQILDVVYQQKEAHLRTLKAQLELAGKIEEAADVQAQIDRLPTEKDHDRTRTEQGTMNPLEAWAKSVPQTAEQVIEALQSIQARGLDSLADAITGVITGTQSLKEAFGSLARSIIADIIQMTVRMLIFRAITAIFGGSLGGLGGGAGGGGGLPGINFRAAGGPVSMGDAYVVGERGPELFVPASNGTILPKVPKIGVPKAANDGGTTVNFNQTIAPNFAGNAMTREEVLQIAMFAKQGAIAAIKEANRRR